MKVFTSLVCSPPLAPAAVTLIPSVALLIVLPWHVHVDCPRMLALLCFHARDDCARMLAMAMLTITCSRRLCSHARAGCAHMLALIHIRCALILMHALINCALYSCTHALIGLSVSCVCSALVLIVPSCSRCCLHARAHSDARGAL
jgi:hypothetical protein